MRSVEEANKWWPKLLHQTSLPDIRDSICDSFTEDSVIYGQRSACWKVFLLFESVDKFIWTKRLLESRDAYTSLREHFLKDLENPDELDPGVDPLSEVASSPWDALRQDETARQEIFQDVERSMPDHLFFREPATQSLLVDILFIWAKLNPDIGYRQGMHEIVAMILWAVERDSIDPATIHTGKANLRDSSMIEIMFDANFVEHDTFTLFSLVMQGTKSSYEVPKPTSHTGRLAPQASNSDSETPMVLRSRRIVEDYLARVDPALATHIADIGIIPQLFAMRWVRLLFGREFAFDDVLHLWDCMFAHDPMLKIVDLICVAMLLRIRWELIEAEYNTALSLLLRYPQPSPDQSTWSLVDDALYLKDHRDPAAGQHLITKYTGRSPPTVQLDRSLLDSKAELDHPNQLKASTTSPSRPSHQSGGIESILQDAARGMYYRGEKWGVNKAVRDAVGEVSKNVGEVRRNIKDLQARHSRHSSTTDIYRPEGSTSELSQKIETLQERSQMLSKMLEGALNELWKNQKDAAGTKSVEDESVKDFTIAIAKVQFVQVYLADPSLPLPAKDEDIEESNSASQSSAEASVSLQPTLAPPIETPLAQQPEPTTLQPKSRPRPSPISASQPPVSAPPPPPLSAPATSEASAQFSRPPLEQSSFSYMLGQDKSAFTSSARPFPLSANSNTASRGGGDTARRTTRSARNAQTAFLFGGGGDEDRDILGVGEDEVGKGKEKSRGSKDAPIAGDEEEEAFRLGSWRGKSPHA